MNHLVKYFLPSQVRGVYRFDETFSQVDGTSYDQFAENKLRFLPCSLIEPIRRCVNLEEDFASVSRQRALKVQPRDVNSRRANAFFGKYAYFQNALQGEGAINGAVNYLEIQFVKKILAPLLNEGGLAAVQPQKRIGPYDVDFAFDGPAKIAIEVDGFGKFGLRSDLDKFMERQNFIVCKGWKIIRFTYGQIMHATTTTLRVLHDVLTAADPHFKEFLTPELVQPQLNLFDAFRAPAHTGPNIFDLVNGFYHAQDWFAEIAIENPTHDVFLRDEVGFSFPLVGLALSSLYHFLDTVAAVVDVNFDLPTVKVSAPAMANEWLTYLHPAITVTGRQRLQEMEHSVDPLVIQNFSTSLPTPLRSEESISFRSGLSLEEIHQGLDYITREIFGYSAGTNRFQDEVLQRIFDGKETLGISTTGSGKSFCFWLPALLKPGLTLVIAPLRSLMRDQRLTLLNYGLASMEFINSDVDAIEQRRYMEEAKLGYLRLLYISPERLRIKKFVEELEALQEFVPINALAIDEAHCISEWGHDFRPSYLKLPSMRMTMAERNPELRLIALTATAGQQVERDMRNVLKLNDTDVVRAPMADRERFSYQIVPVNDGVSKTVTFRKILQDDLATALKQNSLPGLLAQLNSRKEKAIGLVFCIYANPHGKNTALDGTSHYLFEAMDILEPDKVFMPRRGRQNHPKYNLDAFSGGKVRAFSSKPPTLCPRCHSYLYTSNRNRTVVVNDDDDDENELITTTAGLKVCLRCNHEFFDDQALKQAPKKWEELIKTNQIDFKNSRFDILVATKGFGMGIDKSSVRFVIHTSLSSGIESWYQEVGRAGRDNERAHIVLLADPPNDACRNELEKTGAPMRPKCSWTGGCNYDGRQSICDYGKQHLFISRSYPGAETDAVGALRMLDRLLAAHAQTGENLLPIRFNYTDDISRPELALYRLQSLGLVEDYTVVYGQSPRFEVILGFGDLPDSVEEVEFQESMMQISLKAYMSHWNDAGKKSLNLAMVREKYKPLTADFAKKTNKFKILPHLDSSSIQYKFFNTVYEHLLLLLDHTYKDVVTMRYDMLWNLNRVVSSKQCQRVRILPYFEGAKSVDDSYRCGCCNVCSPELDFLDRVEPRPQNPSVDASTNELSELLRNNILDIAKLRQLCKVFRDYRTDTYEKGRAVLEGNPYNLPALYLTREFSPPAELGANTKRFLRTANERMIPVAQLRELYKTSDQQFQSELLLLFNDQDTTCDCQEGWKFLAAEVKHPQHHGNTQVGILRECLDFFMLVEELPPDTGNFRKKANMMEKMINA